MQELLRRGFSGFLYVFILLFCELYSHETFLALFAFFLIVSVYEYTKLVKTPYIPSIILGTLFYVLFNKYVLHEIYWEVITWFSVVICLYGVYFLFSDKTHISKIEKFLYLIGYVIIPFVLLSKIPMGIKGYNPKILIGIFVLIWTQDTFAFIVGKTIGKHKLLERISPKKTIEGFIGGCLFTFGTGLLIAKYFTEASLFIWGGIAIIICIFGTLGDLFESKLKRIANVKDSGNIMPGHGGILDRLDSIIFAAPFLYLFFIILRYVS